MPDARSDTDDADVGEGADRPEPNVVVEQEQLHPRAPDARAMIRRFSEGSLR